jgi:transcription elongation factor GreA
MTDRVQYLTPEGLQKIKDELEHLRTVKRREIADRLAFAIQQGDISENADYEVAKQEQAFNEGRVADLEAILRHARVIREVKTTDEVGIGNRVTVAEDGFPPETYTIVGPAEAQPENGRISYESPVGAALLGKRLGDVAQIKTPAGVLELTVTAIE